MSLLMRNATVSTRYGGGFVQSIDGLSGGQEARPAVDWFYYVNGVEAPKGAAETNVHPGDHIWWDRHDWSQTDDVPAVVGLVPRAVPERDRRQAPAACASNARSSPARPAGRSARACARSACPRRSPRSAAADEPETLRVVVAPWTAIAAATRRSRRIEHGPSASGVYARFSAGGARSRCLNRAAGSTRTLTAGAGLDRGHAHAARSARVGDHGHRRRRAWKRPRAPSTQRERCTIASPSLAPGGRAAALPAAASG